MFLQNSSENAVLAQENLYKPDTEIWMAPEINEESFTSTLPLSIGFWDSNDETEQWNVPYGCL